MWSQGSHPTLISPSYSRTRDAYEGMFLGVAPLSLTLAVAAVFVPMPAKTPMVEASGSSTT
jgi:hypothetical protein